MFSFKNSNLKHGHINHQITIDSRFNIHLRDTTNSNFGQIPNIQSTGKLNTEYSAGQTITIQLAKHF